MSRPLRITGSVTALVGLPFIIALAVPGPAPKIPATEAALTVSATGPEISLRIAAVGAEPAAGAATLASDDGTETATVTAHPVSECPGNAEALTLPSAAGDPTSEWCLTVAGLPDHGSVSGTVTGGGTEERTALDLTVQTREPFRWWTGLTFWVLVLGLLAGLAIALFLPLLTSTVKNSRLALLLAINDSSQLDRRIAGLGSWAATRRSAGASADDVLKAVTPLVRNGPNHAAQERSALQEVLRSTGLPAGQPLLAAATREAKRNDHRISDFLSEDGTRARHPATVLAEGVRILSELYGALAHLETQMDQQRPGAPYPRDLVTARLILQAAGAADIGTARAAVEAAQRAVDSAVGARGGGPGPERSFAGLEVPDLGTGGWAAAVGGLALVTAVAIVVALIFAGVTVYVAAYDAKPTFGGWTDQFALFAAALGSGAAATVLGLVAPWRTSAADDD